MIATEVQLQAAIASGMRTHPSAQRPALHRHDSFSTQMDSLDTAYPEITRVPLRRLNGPDNSLIIPSFHLGH